MIGRELSVVAVTMTALVVVGLVVFAGGDRHALVPSPESTAEGFVRQVVLSRYRQTRQYMASGSRAELSADRLAAWRERLEALAGSISRIDPAGVVMDDGRAVARLWLHGTRADADVSVRVRRENGLWKVDGLPDVQKDK